MLTLLILAAVGAFVGYVVYTTYFGEIQGDHVNGVNAMIYVADHQEYHAAIKAAKIESFKRSIAA